MCLRRASGGMVKVRPWSLMSWVLPMGRRSIEESLLTLMK
jgi:hypothetical protein